MRSWQARRRRWRPTAAADVAGIGSAISAANALVAGPTTALAADRR
ncbi:PE domain-containing protein, partial [Mycobacterium tuberculosis]